MSISQKPSFLFSHIKRNSNGDSVSLSFLDLITFDTSDLSLFDQIHIKIIFSVRALTQYGSQIKVSGNLKELGCWDLTSSIPLYTTPETYPIWTSNPVTISIQSLPFALEYKYIQCNNNTKSVNWENFNRNRMLLIKDKCSLWNSFKVADKFGVFSSNDVGLLSQNEMIKYVQGFSNGQEVGNVLANLAVLIESNEVDLTLIHIVAIVLKTLGVVVKEIIKDFTNFILRCMKKLNIQQTKMILSFIHIPEVELIKPSSSLVDRADICELSIENLDEDFVVNYNLSNLRSSIYTECRSFTNSVALMLTDNNLEKKEMELIENILENIEEKDSIWKIPLVGKWICEMFFYHSIRVKQMNILKTQFEKLEKSENLEVLRDLLYELMDLVIEEYSLIIRNIDHFECECLAKYLNIEYSPIYYPLFLLVSKYITKSIPVVSKSMSGSQFICYSQGSAKGFLHSYNPDFPKIPANSILLINKPDGYIEFSDTISGIIIGATENILIPLLLSAKSKKIPVVLGFLPQLNISEFTLLVNEEFYSLTKIN